MANPKKRRTHSRQGSTRSHHHLAQPPVSICQKCKTLKLAHHICKVCGTYANRQVIKFKEKELPKEEKS
jgi:large subunit ribosomal protein L32